MKKIVLFFVILLGFLMCNKKNPFVSKDVIDKINSRKHPKIGNIAFIYNNDIYYIEDAKNGAVRITFTPDSVKSKIKISHNGGKIAYLNANQSPVVIDIKGNLVANLTSYTSVEKMNWSQDDNTLYILKNNKLYFYGSSISVPTLTYNGIKPANVTFKVIDVAITNNNDLLYSYEANTIPYNEYYMSTVILKKNDGSIIELLKKSNTSIITYMSYCNRTNEILVSSNYGSEQIEIIRNFSSYSYIFDTEQYTYSSPIYCSDLTTLVASAKESSSNNSYLKIRCYNHDQNPDYNFYQYNSSSFPLWIDWK